jgi:hypothetical protein
MLLKVTLIPLVVYPKWPCLLYMPCNHLFLVPFAHRQVNNPRTSSASNTSYANDGTDATGTLACLEYAAFATTHGTLHNKEFLNGKNI